MSGNLTHRKVALCKNARLPYCNSGVRFLGALFFNSIFFLGPILQFQVCKKLPHRPTSHVAHPVESLRCWDCPHDPGLRLRIEKRYFWSTRRPRSRGRCVSSLTWRRVYGLYGWGQGRTCGGPVPRPKLAPLHRPVHTGRPWRSCEVWKLGVTPRNFFCSKLLILCFIYFTKI